MNKNSESAVAFFPAIWNILHDGVIVAVDGTVPGDLRIDVEIGYLRKRIPDPGTLIQVLLIGCTRFAFREYEKSEFSAASVSRAAFTEEECREVSAWVRFGGSLLLIADHTPFGSAAASLAKHFGVEMGNSYVFDLVNSTVDDPTILVFSRENGFTR